MPAPGVVPMLSVERYRVEGSAATEIVRSMAAAARESGGFMGYHTWNLRYSYRTQDSGGRCRFSNVRIEVSSQMRVPEWQRPPDPPAELVAQWEAFSTALDDHERGHRQIAFDGAGEISRRLRDLQDMSCSSLQVEGDREARRLLAQTGERQRQFDTETQHGTGTGAVWPPRPQPPPVR